LALAPAELGSRWSDLRTRVLSAVILAPLALAAIWSGGWAFHLAVLPIAVGLTIEWIRLCGMRSGSPAGLFMLTVVLAAMIATELGHGGAALLLLAAATLLSLAAAALRVAAPRAPAMVPLPHVDASVLLACGIPFIGGGSVAVIWLRDDPAVGLANLLFLLLLVWASDIGAYLVGRTLGGPRLAPRISPGKTWSGALGGLAAAVIAAALVAGVADPPRAPGHLLLVAVLLGITAQSGDLLESLIKRHFGVKDSGHIIPGHGGLLDRLDALLAAAPVAALLALLAGPGVVVWQ
jgi:phosphatidate cytidylyltransferase